MRLVPLVLLCSVLVSAAANSLSQRLRASLAIPIRAASVAAPPPDVPGERALPLEDYLASILGQNLFDPTLTPGGDPPSVAPSASLRLLGTVATVPASLSEAVILEEGATSRTYRLGDTLAGARVVSIERGRVVLRAEDGTEQVLTLSTDLAASPAPSAPARGSGDAPVQIPRETLERYLDDPGALSEMASASLHRGRDGAVDGFQLRAIRRGSPLAQIGLRSGDVLSSVQGVPLDSMGAAMGLVSSLRESPEICLEVLRGGQPRELCYQIP